jgi:hypothetical protein
LKAMSLLRESSGKGGRSFPGTVAMLAVVVAQSGKKRISIPVLDRLRYV